MSITGLLSQSLHKHHRQAGLWLEEDVHFVYLKHGDKTIAVWYTTSATLLGIHTEADEWIAKNKGGDYGKR